MLSIRASKPLYYYSMVVLVEVKISNHPKYVFTSIEECIKMKNLARRLVMAFYLKNTTTLDRTHEIGKFRRLILKTGANA